MPRPPQLSTAARALRESIFSRLQGKLAQHGHDGVPLHLGDTYLSPPPALRLDDYAALHRYGAPAGEPGLLDALVPKLHTQNALPWVTRACLQVTVGATAGLAAAARTILEPGDEILVPSPHWPLIGGVFTNQGGVPVEVPLSQALYADPSLDAAALLEPHIGPRTVALYLTTPNNPDGKVLPRRQLESLATLAQAHDLWVISDEVYEHLSYTTPHVSIASLPGMAERTLTVFSLSKSYALAGYRLGYVVGPPTAMHALRKIANHTVYNVPDVLQRAALTLLSSPTSAAWLDEARQTYVNARDAASRLVRAPHHLPDGATYLFVDLRSYVPDDQPIWPLVEKLLDAGVSISPGEQFGAGFERHARLCFTAVPPDRLQVGLERLARILG
jgi:aspartate/methionine/tyrosine aminotransferase